MSLDGAGPRRLAAFSDSSALTAFVWSPSGRRLHYFTTPDSRKRQYEWRRSILHTADALTGQETGSRDLPPLSRPVLLRDGRLLYYSQKRGTTHPFVEVAIDPETGQLRGEPKPFTSDFDSVVGGVAASADGKIVAAVVGGNDTFSLSYAAMTPGSPKLGPKHRSSNDARPDLPDAWSPDNSTIFFESNRQGHYHIFRHRIGQRSSELVSDLPGDQTMPRVSPDGRWLLFLSAPVHTGAGTRLWNLMRVPIAGGTAERVPFCEPVQEFNCLYKASRCVIREQKDGQMRFYHLDPEKGKGRELARSEAAGPVVFGDWTLSPDGAMVAMVNLLRDPAAIRVIYLDRGLEHEIPIQGPPPTSAVVPVWRADGKGWYFPVAGDRMRQFDWQGRSLFVDDMEFWLVPTTDGKQVAFQDRVRSENVWICRRQ